MAKDGTKVGLTLRLSERLRARLAAAAEGSDKSLNTEVVDRLEASLRADDSLGGIDTAIVLKELAGYVTRAEHLQKRKLLDTTDAVRDHRFDGHMRWLLGGIIAFHRNLRVPPDAAAIDRQVEEDGDLEG